MVAVKVPTIDRHKRIPQKAIDQVVKQIVEKFKLQKIILFGSYARGNPRPESDVVVVDPKNWTLPLGVELRARKEVEDDKVVLELISGQKGMAEASREYNIKDTGLSRGKQEFIAKARQVFEQPQEMQEKEARRRSWSAWLAS